MGAVFLTVGYQGCYRIRHGEGIYFFEKHDFKRMNAARKRRRVRCVGVSHFSPGLVISMVMSFCWFGRIVTFTPDVP